jgi:iron complex transport system permease protein
MKLINVAPSGRPGHFVVRTRAFDVRLNRRVLLQVCLALAAATLAALWAMTQGTFDISIGDAFRAAVGQGSPQHEQIVQNLRMPRIFTALLVGGCLAISGAIFQGLIRNELASPDIIGINSGAGAIGFVWLLVTRNVTALPWVLFLGAMGMATLVYAMSWKRGIDPNRLILVGMGIQAMLSAIETFMVRLFPIEDAIWADSLLLGSVATADWGDVRLLTVGLIVLAPCALLFARPLRALQLGDDTAGSVGLRVELVRFGLIAVGCWFSALAIAVAGLVGFIALMVPHIARMIAGPVSGGVLVLTGVIGAMFLVVADTVGHNLLPISIPVSIVMGVIGAPYFLLLFWRSRVRM